MKPICLSCLCLVLLSGTLAVRAQGSFQNLEFESANVTGYPVNSYEVPIDSAMPGWSGSYASTQFGSSQALVVGYDFISLGAARMTIVDPNAPQLRSLYWTSAPLEGDYSVALFGQGLSSPTATTISQTAIVPSWAKSLQARMVWTLAAPVVAPGGQTLTMVPLQTLPDYTLYGADISTLAGQLSTLSFTEPPPTVGTPSSLLLDDIVFSPQVIPEPGAVGLLGLCAGLYLWSRRRKHITV
jgi:hypothetical protein